MLPIILIHGFPFDGTMWKVQAGHLRATGFAVHAPDLAGFGASAVPVPVKEKSSMERYADEVYSLIQSVGGRAVVGGLSMGGYVLLALLRAHPEAVAGAILLDTRAEADTHEARANRLKSIDDVQKTGTTNLIDGLCARLFRKSPDVVVVGEARAIMRRQRADAVIAAQWAMAHRQDQTSLLASLNMPVLVGVGEEDLITPPQVSEAMAARLRRGTLKRFANAGHMANMEQPAAVNDAMAAFLKTL